jgi:ankyrin repeat protein
MSLRITIGPPYTTLAAKATKKLKQLVQAGAQLNVADELGNTALHRAVMKGDEGIVLYLIKKGARVRAANKTGETPLHIASAEGQERVVQILIESGASTSAKNTEGQTPADIAAFPRIVHLLNEAKEEDD